MIDHTASTHSALGFSAGFPQFSASLIPSLPHSFIHAFCSVTERDGPAFVPVGFSFERSCLFRSLWRGLVREISVRVYV